MSSTKLHKLKTEKDSKCGVQEVEKTGLRVFKNRSHPLWRVEPSKHCSQKTERSFSVSWESTHYIPTQGFLKRENTHSKTAFDESTAKYHKHSWLCIFKRLVRSSFRLKIYSVDVTFLPKSPILITDCIGSRIWAVFKFLRDCLEQLVFLYFPVKGSLGHLLKQTKSHYFSNVKTIIYIQQIDQKMLFYKQNSHPTDTMVCTITSHFAKRFQYKTQ